MDESLRAFLEALDYDGEPFGMFYTDQEPPSGFVPKPGPALSMQLEQSGGINWQEVWGSFSCVIGSIWLARKKNTAAYFEADRYGCMGGSFYLGFHQPQLDFITHYVSTGVPGTQVHGERYLRSPETVRRFFTEIAPGPPRSASACSSPWASSRPAKPPRPSPFSGARKSCQGLCSWPASSRTTSRP